jgi:type III restriction enzyme
MIKSSQPGKEIESSSLAQIIGLVEKVLRSDRIRILPALFNQDELRRRILLTLNMTKIVQHIWEAMREGNTERLTAVFDGQYPIRSTGDMRTWYTGRPCEYTTRSHVNFCVFDSTWEASEAFILDHDSNVEAWVKNDHLGFEVLYVFKGVVKKYRPDFLIRLTSGKMLVLEVKGQDTQQDQSKRAFLEEWCKAVNTQGGFGVWERDVSYAVSDLKDILAAHNIV